MSCALVDAFRLRTTSYMVLDQVHLMAIFSAINEIEAIANSASSSFDWTRRI